MLLRVGAILTVLLAEANPQQDGERGGQRNKQSNSQGNIGANRKVHRCGPSWLHVVFQRDA